MGNTLLDDNKKQDPKQMYEQWLEQNPDLVGRKVLTHNKLFETNYFKYCEFSIKMQVFFRRDNTPIQDYLKAFQVIQALVERYKCTHILPMRLVEMKESKDKEFQKYSQNFAAGMRQYLHMTLQERLQTRPCLTEQQKIWIIYQIVFAMYTIHDVFNIYHGNVRTSNFLLTTYHYLLLTDFASYKPTHILQDTEQGLSEFRLFYASSVEKCNFPPEKLVDKDITTPEALNSKNLFNATDQDSSKEKAGDSSKKIKKNVTEDSDSIKKLNNLKMMDMYSMGLTILEVLNDGRPTMSYSDLLRMKKEGLNLEQHITDSVSKLTKGQTVIGDLLKDLLKQNPEQRPKATTALQRISSMVEHQFYLLLWSCLSAFNRSSFSSCDLRINFIFSLIDFIENQVRESGYRWANQPPRSLSGFKALKIFVQLIDKNAIFSPKIQSSSSIFARLFKFIEQADEANVPVTEEQIIVEQVDERRKFFINPSKKSKIAKRMSIAFDFHPKTRQLCPPSFKHIENLIQHRHVPVKLTHIGLRSPRQEELIRQYKNNQPLRAERMKEPRYYKSCEIMIKIVFACIRGCKYIASKLQAVQIIGLLAKDCSDQFRLHEVLPYLIHLSQDTDISVARQAFLALINLFYLFIDPFYSEEDIHYYEVIIEYLTGIIKQPKLRSTLFAHFKEIFAILQWLEIHYKRFSKTLKVTLSRLLEVLKVQYGYYSKEEIKLLLDNNIPEHFLPDMFEFYISLINTDRLEGLRLSLTLARHVSPLTHRRILEAFDSCIEGGLDESGIGLFYSLQYFTLRKNTSASTLRKIAPHVLNPSKWVRDEAIAYMRMCLNEYPPTKNYFFFKDILEPPFPLKPEDIDDEFLLPPPLKDSDVDWRERKVKNPQRSPTIALFQEYLTLSRTGKERRRGEEESERWTEAMRGVTQGAVEGKLFNFQNYTKKQLELLYEYNLLYYVLNMNRYQPPEKDKPQDKNYQLLMAFKKLKLNIDLNSIDHEKKELFEQFQGYINSSFERLISKKNRDNGQSVSQKIKLAEAILTIGEVLSKFQMFKIKPIPRLGTYVRQPTTFQKLAKPKGILISEVFEHAETVTALEKVADQFLLSGSADGTLRVFDTKKILTNVTTCSDASLELRGEGDQKVKISAIAAFERTYAAVVGTNRGQIRVYPIERMGKAQNYGRSDQIVKYFVGGQLQRIVTLENQLKNECFCYVTAEGNLGVQDIRLKSRAMVCSIGRERGIPRALCATGRNCILVGTVDGYVVNFDMRFNVISSVLQLQNERETLPVTNIVSVPFLTEQQDELFAFTYPGKHYEFSCFNLQQNRQQFGPERQYSSSAPEEILTTPFLANRTSDEQFKLCRNSLTWRKAYDELSDFSKNFNIFDYLSDPLTRKEAKIREVWLDNSKNRYNQISSLYHRKQLPFLEWLHAGVLTALNPLPAPHNLPAPLRSPAPFALLADRRDNALRDPSEVERTLTVRPNKAHRILGFAGEESKEWISCCRVLPTLVVVSGRNNQLKIYM